MVILKQWMMDDNNPIYWLDRKYGDKTHQKYEIREGKARLHTVLENGNVSAYKTFGDLKVQSWAHISHRILERLSTNMWQHARNTQ